MTRTFWSWAANVERALHVHLLGLAYYYDRQEIFSDVDGLINRAKILIAHGLPEIDLHQAPAYQTQAVSSPRAVFLQP